VLLSARRVGPSGFAWGVDMTDDMLALARQNAAEAGAASVEFVKGTIEAVPLPDASVDVVISNCVINLSVDKPAVLAEMFRVLMPGGRIGICDIVAEDQMSPADRVAAGSYKPLDTGKVQAADIVITMGCGDACPVYPGKRYLDWDLPDPAGLPIEQVRPIRDQISARVRALISELDA
jgi:ubiquinone/menaquinone biosynthesis C-methylase UbiE